jgi:hypothetical protein
MNERMNGDGVDRRGDVEEESARRYRFAGLACSSRVGF